MFVFSYKWIAKMPAKEIQNNKNGLYAKNEVKLNKICNSF